MLVLTRKVGESIRIGDNIKLTVIEADGSNIKLGIDAPRSVKVHREEVFERILEENKQAAQVEKVDMGQMAALFKNKK